MGAPYSSQPISNYNANPPSDDGSATTLNQMTWASLKTKLPDPIKVRTDNMDSALVIAFTKTLGGGGITSISTDYTVQSSDQGKLIKATASLTLTLGDATAFTAPFCHGFVNLSGTTITVQGSGGQTIDGNTSVQIAPQAGFLAFTDGANWNTTGLQGTLIGKQLMAGDIINGTIVQSNSSNAVTFTLKTLAGNTPSSTDPVLVCFRNATAGTGNYVYRAITAATSVTVSSGSTLGATNNVPFRVWMGLLDNAGTVEMFVVNCFTGTAIYPLGQFPIISTTAEGGAGASDSAGVPYSTTARSSVAYCVLGYADYNSGLSTAGSWNVNPSRIQLYGPGVPLPGNIIQTVYATNSTTKSVTSSTPAATNLTASITPTSAANAVKIIASGPVGTVSFGTINTLTLRRGTSTSIGNSGAFTGNASGGTPISTATLFALDAPGTTSSQAYSVYISSSDNTNAVTWSTGNTTSTIMLDEVMA
jgi:hypothetical protein